MKLRNLLVLTFLFTMVFSVNTFARKPAVEDFVGVETENYRPTTKGTEVLFNFGNHINSIEKEARNKQKTTGWIATGTLVASVLLPFFMWFGITNTLKKEALVIVQSLSKETYAKNAEHVYNQLLHNCDDLLFHKLNA